MTSAHSMAVGGSVFDKVRATTRLLTEAWKIQTHAFNVTGNQTVSWTFFQQMQRPSWLPLVATLA